MTEKVTLTNDEKALIEMALRHFNVDLLELIQYKSRNIFTYLKDADAIKRFQHMYEQVETIQEKMIVLQEKKEG